MYGSGYVFTLVEGQGLPRTVFYLSDALNSLNINIF